MKLELRKFLAKPNFSWLILSTKSSTTSWSPGAWDIPMHVFESWTGKPKSQRNKHIGILKGKISKVFATHSNRESRDELGGAVGGLPGRLTEAFAGLPRNATIHHMTQTTLHTSWNMPCAQYIFTILDFRALQHQSTTGSYWCSSTSMCLD